MKTVRSFQNDLCCGCITKKKKERYSDSLVFILLFRWLIACKDMDKSFFLVAHMCEQSHRGLWLPAQVEIDGSKPSNWGRNDRQKHGQSKKAGAGRQTNTNNRLEGNVWGDRLADFTEWHGDREINCKPQWETKRQIIRYAQKQTGLKSRKTLWKRRKDRQVMTQIGGLSDENA